jgi:cathepsin A (carboxypeptidase C)
MLAVTMWDHNNVHEDELVAEATESPFPTSKPATKSPASAKPVATGSKTAIKAQAAGAAKEVKTADTEETAEDTIICDKATSPGCAGDKILPKDQILTKEWVAANKAIRSELWEQNAADLQHGDKAMHAALLKEMDDPHSVQWARYIRHQNRAPPAKAGHTFMRGGDTIEASLEETSVSSHKKGQLCDKTVKQHHGYFKLKGGNNKNYFYWLFEARENPKNAPLVLWLTGGPGCSSEIALFTENGPCSVAKDGRTTKTNAYSWNGKANILFVDQPAGTGFSYGRTGDYDKNEHEVSTDLYHFLQEVVKKYPQYHKAPLYIFGESYAGHFVPSTTHRVFQGNQAKTGEYLALRGQGIGNGLTDAYTQYPYYPEMAFNSKTTPKVVTEKQYRNMRADVAHCQSLIKSCQADRKSTACSRAFANCNGNLIDPVQVAGMNVYDLRSRCKKPPLCYDMSPVRNFLQSSKVRRVLGVKRKWAACNMYVNSMFHVDWMQSQKEKIPPVLKNGVRTLIYAGDVDFICNWMGNKAWTLALQWPGKEAFNAAKDKKWVVNGKSLGKERHHGGFTFLQVHKAGHMVPMDQPEAAMLLFNAFIKNEVLVPTTRLE